MDHKERVAQEKKQANERRAQELAERDIEDAFKAIMDSKAGRLVMSTILIDSGVISSSASSSGYRTNETFALEGKRMLGVIIEGRLKTISPSNYIKMKQEELARLS